MSEYQALRLVSLSLQKLLGNHIPSATAAIDLQSPKEMRGATPTGTKGISLWLYRVTRNGDTLNHPPLRVVPNQRPRHPIPINLYYLVTPIFDDPLDEQEQLGKVLQVFNDHAILSGSDLQDGLTELHITLETLSLEELTRVWDALKEPYQLSVSYLVQLVTIDSDHEPVQTSPVLVRESTYTQILSVT